MRKKNQPGCSCCPTEDELPDSICYPSTCPEVFRLGVIGFPDDVLDPIFPFGDECKNLNGAFFPDKFHGGYSGSPRCGFNFNACRWAINGLSGSISWAWTIIVERVSELYNFYWIGQLGHTIVGPGISDQFAQNIFFERQGVSTCTEIINFDDSDICFVEGVHTSQPSGTQEPFFYCEDYSSVSGSIRPSP